MMYEKNNDRKTIMRQTGAYSVWKQGFGGYIHKNGGK